MAGDVIQEITGSFGRYQLFLCILVFISKFFIAFHQLIIIFFAPKVSFKCDGVANKCPCSNPVYDTTLFDRTIITEWNLICERKWMASFTQTIFQFGVLIGSVLFGMAADSYGRKIPLCVSVVVQLVGGCVSAFAPGYWLFTALRFVIGAAIGGMMVTSYVIVVEFIGVEYRELISALYQVPFNMGHMLVPLIGYLARDYRYMQLAISLPAVVMLSYFCLVPESPRWLIAVKRTNSALDILTRAAKMNNRPTENIRSLVETYEASLAGRQAKKSTIRDLFRTPNIRCNTICMAYAWLTCGYSFYGVSQYVGQLGGNVFLNVAASATFGLLGSLVSIPLLRYAKRRTVVMACNLICAVCLLALAAMPQSQVSVVLACVAVISAFIVFVVIYLYCGEMFPTVVRNAAVGFSSMASRIGSMTAPFVIDLQDVATWLPAVVLALGPATSCAVTFFMPETKGCQLMNTIEEGENLGKKVTAPAPTAAAAAAAPPTQSDSTK